MEASWKPYLVGIVSGLAIGVALGFVVGDAAGCGESCGFDVVLFEAVGTWVGGVVIAAVVASYTLYRSHRDRIEDDAKQNAVAQAAQDAALARKQAQDDARLAREQAADEARIAREESALREARALAVMCTVRFTPLGDEINGFSRVDIRFTNNVDEIVFWPRLLVGEGLDLGTDEQVWPGNAWGKSTTMRALGLDDTYPTEKDARTAINRDGRSTVVFEYTIRGVRFVRTRDAVLLARDSVTPSLSGSDGAERGAASAR